MINTKKQKEHNFKDRSCLSCDRLQDCHVKDEVNSAVIHADKGRYGCRYYIGQYINEEGNKEKRKRLRELKKTNQITIADEAR